MTSAPRAAAANAALKGSATFWFLTAVAGQFIFAAYVMIHYGGSAARGDLGAWNKTLIHGLVAGDTMGNVMVALHLLLAVILTLGGPLQLVPRLRARWPRLHRWNGRIYLSAAVVIALGGLYMVWTRGMLGGVVNAIAISINALLILVCAAMTLRHALARRLDIHRRWAVRLFLVVSGVWFFRVGLMLWVLINKGPVGVGEQLDGPFAIALAFGQYVVPLAVFELYLYAQRRPGTAGRFAMAAGLSVLTLGMGAGIVVAALGMWLPRL